MSQEKIAGRLKLLTALLGIMGLGFFTLMGVNTYKAYFIMNGLEIPQGYIHISASHFIPFLVVIVTMVLCYVVLYIFYRVCCEIEHENSFSAENVRNFVSMRNLLLVLAALWTVCLVMYLILAEKILFAYLSKYLMYALAFLAIAAFADALSKLIERARQIREENDLTI